MPRYVLLVDWTEQGVQSVERTIERLEQGAELGEDFGSGRNREERRSAGTLRPTTERRKRSLSASEPRDPGRSDL